ncbi:MAG: FRG domain-containing protein [Rhodothermaceae bacterium]|nr:FRG domain-containing protein [Rhodothermaceae bacterium]MYE62412.1 FRG domain-containing protein [Rhodothermaceae bacterium]MYJ21126.1 FRG domain-containing protein [Rhodothermaceae bacterium]
MANPQHVQWLLEGVDSWNRRRSDNYFSPDLSGVDIYEEYKNIGLVNNNGVASLPRINLEMANLSGAIFSGFLGIEGADCRKASFRSADLTKAVLSGASFEGANFMHAKLNGTFMDDAKLRGADMSYARFTGTNLSGANLTDAQFANASFKDIYLSGASLKGADFTMAELVGIDLSKSRLWQAKLYPEDMSYPRYGEVRNSTRPVQSIAGLLEAVRSIKTQLPDAVLFFRGEAANSWELRPSVMRHSKEGKFRFRANEGKMLLDLMARRPIDFQGTRSALAQWVIAQHHGLKTRLLDITRNPLVALFWCCIDIGVGKPQSGKLHVFSLPRELIKPFNSDTTSVIANFAKLSWEDQNILLGRSVNDITEKKSSRSFQINYQYSLNRLYQLIRKENPHFDDRINPKDFYRVFVVEPEQSFERIQAQSGAFLISAFHERFERDEVLNSASGVPIYGHHIWEIPTEDKKRILDELDLVNITRETLLPSLDESAKAIIDIYLP